MGQIGASGHGKTKSDTVNTIIKYQKSITPRESQESCRPFCTAAKTAWRNAVRIARSEL